jgi:hypothetical protein
MVVSTISPLLGGYVKFVGLVALLLASGFLSAQDGTRGLDLRIQAGIEQTRPFQSILLSDFSNPGNPRDFKIQPDKLNGVSVRMLGEWPDTPGVYYELGGMFKATTKYDYDFIGAETGYDMSEIEVAYSYFGFGCAYILNTRVGFSVGAHLEGRIERIVTSGPLYQNDQIIGNLDGSVSYLRPWGRLSMDFTFNNSGNVRPYIGIEASYPLTKQDQKDARWNLGQLQDERLMKSIAPQGSLGAYIGFRF